MDIERERGITIKMAAVRLNYKAQDGQDYELNLIDTPGHVDFTYEVSRSLAACEGAVLVVDAAQGVEAQTLANVNLALNNHLEIVPVINKIDLPAADPDRVAEEIEEVLAIDATEAIRASAKEGIGTQEILESIVRRVPPPQGDAQKPLRALIFDSHFDAHLGVVAYVRVRDGEIAPGTQIRAMASGKTFDVTGVGIFAPRMKPVDEADDRRGRLHHRQRQDRRRLPRRGHADGRPRTARPSRWPATARRCRSSSAACTP